MDVNTPALDLAKRNTYIFIREKVVRFKMINRDSIGYNLEYFAEKR